MTEPTPSRPRGRYLPRLLPSVNAWLTSRSSPSYLTMLIASAFILRLLWVALVPAIPVSDAAVYDELAARLARGMGYVTSWDNSVPTAYRPPGYPVFLALLYAVFGRHYWTIGIAQAMLGTLSCLLTYRLGATLFGEGNGRLAGLALAFYPNHIYYAALVMSETLFVIVMLIALYVLAMPPPLRARSLLAAGIAAGVSALVKPSAIILWAFVAVWLLATEKGRRRVFSPLLFLVSMAAAILPWTLRNVLVMKAPVLISTNGGVNFYIGNNETATGGYHFPPDNPLLAIDSEVERSAEGYRLGLEFIRNHPVRWLLLMPPKLLSLMGWDVYGVRWSFGVTRLRGGPPHLVVLGAIAVLAYSLVLILGLAGMVRCGWRTDQMLLLSSVLVSWVVTHVILFGIPRFHFPLIPIFLLFAVALTDGAQQDVWRPRRGQ